MLTLREPKLREGRRKAIISLSTSIERVRKQKIVTWTFFSHFWFLKKVGGR